MVDEEVFHSSRGLHDTNLHECKADSFLVAARATGADFAVFLETLTTADENPLRGLWRGIFEGVAHKKIFKGISVVPLRRRVKVGRDWSAEGRFLAFMVIVEGCREVKCGALYAPTHEVERKRFFRRISPRTAGLDLLAGDSNTCGGPCRQVRVMAPCSHCERAGSVAR